MLCLDWFYTGSLDFEYKNYILLSYLSQIDSAYAIHKLSPYLLYTEKLIKELEIFKINIKLFNKEIKKDIVGLSSTGIIYKEISTPDKLKEIIEIVDYSKPLLEDKIKLGYILYNKYPQLLF